MISWRWDRMVRFEGSVDSLSCTVGRTEGEREGGVAISRRLAVRTALTVEGAVFSSLLCNLLIIVISDIRIHASLDLVHSGHHSVHSTSEGSLLNFCKYLAILPVEGLHKTRPIPNLQNTLVVPNRLCPLPKIGQRIQLLR